MLAPNNQRNDLDSLPPHFSHREARFTGSMWGLLAGVLIVAAAAYVFYSRAHMDHPAMTTGAAPLYEPRPAPIMRPEQPPAPPKTVQ